MNKKNKAKKHSKKKQRVPIVGLDFGKSVEISNIRFEGKRLILKDIDGNIMEPLNVTVGDAYHRNFKPKIIRQIQADPKNILLDTKQLLRSHDITLFADTNYQKFQDFNLCVSASILVRYETEDGNRVGYGYPQNDFLFLTSPSENPERFGWWDIIKRFVDSPFYNENGNYGLVVDSDLGDLPKINSRQDSVRDDLFLPLGIQILYASADVGKESYINQEIKLCDSRSKKTLSQVIPIIDVDKMKNMLKGNTYHAICYLEDKKEA